MTRTSQIAEKLIQEAEIHISPQENPAEFTLMTMFILAGLRSQDDRWLQMNYSRPLQQQTGAGLNYQGVFLHLQEILQKPLHSDLYQQKFQRPLEAFGKKLNSTEIPCPSLIHHWRWREVPGFAWNTLEAWAQRKFQLEIVFGIPSPKKILMLQTKGQRCVSVFREAHHLSEIHEHHRDAFLFTVHDLEHAWQFFSNAELFHHQKAWALKLWLAFFQGPWKTMAWIQKEDFDYLISDMNTHPWHGFLTLQNLWMKEWKKQKQWPLWEKLPSQDETQCQKAWNELLQYWDLEKLEAYPESKKADFFLSQLETSSSNSLQVDSRF